MSEEENDVIVSEEIPPVAKRETRRRTKQKDKPRVIVDTFTPNVLEYLKEKNSIWTFLTDPPFAGWVAVEHYVDGVRRISYEHHAAIKAIERYEKNKYIYRNGPTNPFEIWMEWDKHNVAKYPQFLPGITENLLPEILNIWQPSEYTPTKCAPELLLPLQNHLRLILAGGNEKVYQLLLKWFANTIQRPQERYGISLILLGAQGCGKGVVAEYMKKLHAPHYFEATKLADILGNFNAQVENTTFVYMDNISYITKEDSEALKTNITQNVLTINEKGQPKRQAKNFTNFMFSSNNRESPLIQLERDDRRFFILDANDHYAYYKNAADRTTYFNRLWADLNNREIISGWLHYLKYEVTVSADDFREIPDTSGRVLAQTESYNSVIQWLLAFLTEGNLPQSFTEIYYDEPWPIETEKEAVNVYKHLLYQDYTDYWDQYRGDFMALGERSAKKIKLFTQEMARLNPLILRSGNNWGRRATQGKRPWCFPFPPLETYRKFVADILDKPVEALFQV